MKVDGPGHGGSDHNPLQFLGSCSKETRYSLTRTQVLRDEIRKHGKRPNSPKHNCACQAEPACRIVCEIKTYVAPRVYTHTATDARTYTHIDMYTHTHTQNIHIHIYIYIYLFICMYTYIHFYVHICTSGSGC